MAKNSKPESNEPESNEPESNEPESNAAGHRAWAVSADHFVNVPQPASGVGRAPAPRVGISSSTTQVQLDETGITWDRSAVDWSLLERSTVDRVRSRFRASLPEYIWDAAALEGNPYTLPEVQTLLEGITVTGHRIADQDQILALNDGFNLTDELVGARRFDLDKATSDDIHAKGENSSNLKREFHRLTTYLLEDVEDPREQAIAYFCAATRRQFYFDGNKRTAKLMMAGHLMQNSYDAISISARRQLEFNQLLAPMFDTGDATRMMQFIIDSRPA